ncbi:MAG: hypothetical protein LH603_20330 [Pseudonocardia sp.]|nr:hypothetical protein [Pseudonocardia sp.]
MTTLLVGVATESGAAPRYAMPLSGPAHAVDTRTGALVGAGAALPLLAPQVGRGGLGLGGSTVECSRFY